MTATGGRIEAVIFDMDGVLIDSEPLWRRVELGVFNRLGCALVEADTMATMGVPVLDVVKHWYRRSPWVGPSPEVVAAEIVDAVVDEVTRNGVPMRGVASALDAAAELGLPCAIASSSPLRLIKAVVGRLGVGDAISVLCSADDEAMGKPNPAVFLRAASRLGVSAARCLIIEDSVNGVRAALAAGAVCAVIPDPAHAEHPIMSDAHHRLGSLDEMTAEWLRGLTAAPVTEPG